uniref:Uncharacterized protein n=3 Tax=Aegilops tauschii subsp. strangulata TaxID=200361 RepID=A0A453R173_AEGTS
HTEHTKKVPSMATKAPSWCTRFRSPASAVWFLPAAVFILLLLLLRRPTMDPYAPAAPRSPVSSRRADLYGRMARDLDERGAAFLKGGETSQSLTLSDLFDIRDGAVVPRLKAADPPVRANVLYLDPVFAAEIAKAVKEVFLPYFDKAIWFQNSSMYHFSMFHASHHLEPILATKDEVIKSSDWGLREHGITTFC